MRFLLFSILLLTACDRTGQIKSVTHSTSDIQLGMTKEEVVKKLGAPGNRSFSETKEALQYCESAFNGDRYLTVWLEDQKVTRLTTDQGYVMDGDCVQPYPVIDWGQVPPDTKIEKNVNVKSEK